MREGEGATCTCGADLLMLVVGLDAGEVYGKVVRGSGEDCVFLLGIERVAFFGPAGDAGIRRGEPNFTGTRMGEPRLRGANLEPE